MDYTKQEKHFLSYMKEIESYNEALSLMFWDLRTNAPKKSVSLSSETIGFLSQKVHQLSTSEQMKGYIEDLKGTTENPIIKRAIFECEKEYNRNMKIPNEEYKEYVQLQTKSEAVWEEAKEKSDFKMFQPYLQRLVDFNIKFANYWGYDNHIYDALLDLYEPGVTVDVLDDVFPTLQNSIKPLLEAVINSPYKPDTSSILVNFPRENQKAFSEEVLRQMGYDFHAGRLDETVHPFMVSLNPKDVRVTTRYNEQDFRIAVFGTIHEGGHALYEQNLDEKLYGTPLASGTSNGIHESQSLFWENFIARSEPFWNQQFDILKKYAPASISSMSKYDFYRAINEVKPSFIRVEADEMTYSLHIMLRYELEKALISGEISVNDLPSLWNEKMDKYLGIRPKNDQEGVLQDVHWAGGSFGYFPSYALGYMYGAQFLHAMNEQFQVNHAVENNDLRKIQQWLSDNIHKHGKMKKPLEILHDVTGEGLNPDYLVDYLKYKYKDIYQF
ncbi:carboxypeptidase M32 [Salirhabdus salicampi]|uniref:carboxypeptidase M32 n=1 Tax=Salirhabdus salicampi TaxID=476102 RepID=UPI00266D9AAF|nr:carboxypeptidase M32 [Salirhabdus salicampi]